MTAAVTKSVNVKFTQNGAQTVTREVNKMGRAAKGTTTQVSSLQSALLKVGGFAAITLALRKATTAALDFGTAMAEVSTLLPDDKDMATLTRSVKELSIAFGKSPTEEAKALYQIISAGASTATEATATLTAANKLAIAGITDVVSAADALTGTMNAYGDAISGAQEVSDKFFQTVKLGKTTVGELSASIGLVSPIAAEMGVSLDSVLAATASLTKSNVKTAVSMRGLRQIMVSVNKPTSEAAALAKKLEINFTGAALKAQGFAKFLNTVKEATKGSQEQLGLLFGNVEALLPVMKLTGSAADDFASNLESIANSAGASDEAFAKIAATAEFKLNKAMARFEVLIIDIGSVIAEVVAPAALLLADNLDVLAVALLGVTAALVALNFTSFITGITAATVATIAFTTALLVNPIFLITTAIAAAVIAIIKLNNQFHILDVAWEILKNSLLIGWNTIKIAVTEQIGVYQDFISSVNNGLFEIQKGFVEAKLAFERIFGTDEGVTALEKSLSFIQEEQRQYNILVEENKAARIGNVDALKEENKALQDIISTEAERWAKRRQAEEEGNAPGGGGADTGGGAGTDTGAALAQADAQSKLNKALERGLQLTKSLRTADEIYRDRLKEINELLEQGAISQETYNRALNKYDEELEGANKESEVFSNTLQSIIDGSTSASDIFVMAAKQIVNALLDMTFEAQKTKDAFSDLGSILSGGRSTGGIASFIGQALASVFGPSPTPTATAGGIRGLQPSLPSGSEFGGATILTANGGVHQAGRLHKFQLGGVIQTPTTFPLAGGNTGVMSEAAPEAIMPLNRGKNGRLGVDATGTGANVSVNIIDQRQSGQDAQVSESRDASGNRQITVLIRDTVRKGFSDGAFDKNMKVFGLARAGTRRN